MASADATDGYAAGVGSAVVSEAGPRPAPGHRRWLPRLGLVIAAWAAMPRIVSPPFRTARVNELADHVVPAAVVLLVSLWAIVSARPGRQSQLAMLIAGFVIALAGFWMGATHLPLLIQALRHQAPWPATLHHAASAVAVLTYGAIWSTLYWNPLPEPRP